MWLTLRYLASLFATLDVGVDANGGSVTDQFVLSSSCLEDPLATLDETLYCSLGGIIWDINEEPTALQATVETFVGSNGSAAIRREKIG